MDGNQIQFVVPRLVEQPEAPEHEHQHGKSSNFSVPKALQYTPLATSVLQAHDRIPIPQICRPRESARLTSSKERKAMEQQLLQYPAGKLKDKLASLLNPSVLAEIKFRQPPRVDGAQHALQQQSKKSGYTLTPVGRMVLDMTKIDYTHPQQHESIKAEEPTSVSATLGRTTSRLESTQIKTPDMLQISLNLPVSKEAASQTPLSKLEPVTVRIPKSDKATNTNEHGVIPQQVQGNSLASLHVQSQKEASDRVLQDFQNNLMEVFEAEDQLDAGSTDVYDQGFFDVQEEGDENEASLSMRILDQLQLGLKKLVSLKRLIDVSSEHLRRLQRLCEPPIDRAQTISLKPPTDPTTNDIEEWRHRTTNTVKGLASAAVCLQTIIGCPHDEQIISTDARGWVANVLINVFENCIIPVIEARADGQDAGIFSTASSNKDVVKRLMEYAKRLLDVMTTVCTEVKCTDSSVNPIEFLCAKLIFVQNASNDKSSCIGVQPFEKVRKVAMSCLARIYARFSGERATIRDEILSSLDKLPSNSRTARQYKLGDGKSIQLVSALFMQLVQTTSLAMPSSERKHRKQDQQKQIVNTSMPDVDGDSDPDDEMDAEGDLPELEEESGLFHRLSVSSQRLFDSSFAGANDIITYLVSRASKTTKTGDSPYRNILDLFITDLVEVLPLPDWPASELMLRMMAKQMIDLAAKDKAALTKSMALESLGIMGSAISSLKASLPGLVAALEREGRVHSELSRHLCNLARDFQTATLRMEDLVALNGPPAIVARQLAADAGESLRLRSACGYFLAHYAKLIAKTKELHGDENDPDAEPVKVATWLLDVIPQIGSGDDRLFNTDAVSVEESELAYNLFLLRTGFSGFFPRIVKTLSSSFSSDQAQIRTRSLKSVLAMLETDSSLLNQDPTIAEDILRCTSDESSLVREASLSLLAKFMITKPNFEAKGIRRLLECASDPKVIVQKRAIGLLKDVYIADKRPLLKSKISSTFLHRTGDAEESIAELAKKTLSEIWIYPALSKLVDPVESVRKVAVEDLCTEIVRCIAHNPTEMSPLLQKFLVSALDFDLKFNKGVRELLSKIVDDLFEKTITGAEDQGPLHTLAAFASASSQLIQPEKLAKLQNYLTELKTENDLFVFRSVLHIFRCVLPDLSATHKPLLFNIQTALMKAVSALGRRLELDSVMACLSTIDSVLHNTLKLVKLTASVLLKIRATSNNPRNCARLIRIAGAIGRHIDVENFSRDFAKEVKSSEGVSVTTYMSQILLPFTKASYPLEIRAAALESLGSICQATPALLNQHAIPTALFAVFSDREAGTSDQQYMQLQQVVLRTFDELYASRAQAKEGEQNKSEEKEVQELGKLGGDHKQREGHSAVVIITPQVVKCVLKLSLSTQGDNAVLATKILASVSHEGLIHPKQSTAAFVALGSSPDDRIASVAHTAHQLLHQTHESVVDREYMGAVQAAFKYQMKVVGDPTGARPILYTSKLAKCFEIINSSGSKYIKKFLSGLVSRITQTLTLEDTKEHTVEQAFYACFVSQNIAFFEYSKLDDLLHVILQLELAYSKSGGEVAQRLESALSPTSMLSTVELVGGASDQLVSNGVRESHPAPAVKIDTVRQLAPIAATLTLLMETRSYLKRQYAVGRDVRDDIQSNKAKKEGAKALVRVHGITGDRIWTKTNEICKQLDNEEGIVLLCRNFVALMNIDDEVQVEADTVHVDGLGGLGDGSNDFTRAGTPGISRKRKGSASAGTTPVKKPKAKMQKPFVRSGSFSTTEDMDSDFAG